MFKGRMRCAFFALLVIVPFLCLAVPTDASPAVFCFIDGRELICDDVDPMIVQGRTMVPIRAISEGLGMQVEWIKELRVVQIFTGKTSHITIPPLTDRNSVSAPLIFVDDVQLPSDVDPVIIQNRTMVPVRVIVEYLGMKVDWDETTRHVYIKRPEPPPVELEIPTPDPDPPQIEEPLPEVPEVQYLGISIIGSSLASAGDMARVAFDAVAPRVYPGINEVEAAAYLSRGIDSVDQQYQEVTTAEVARLTAEINRSRQEINQYSPAQRDEILTFVACTYYKLAILYEQKGQQYGIRGDIAFFQAVHETGWWRFGGLVTPDQNNYCGLSATGQAASADEPLRGANPARVQFFEGKHGAFFDTPATGVEAQLQHLYAYATVEDLPAGVDLLSPRFDLVSKGIAPNWEDLGGRWAVPGYPRGAPNYYENLPDPFAAAFADGQTYGQTILAYYFRTGYKQ